MTAIILILLVAVLFVPNYLLLRKQKQQREELAAFQQALTPGKRVITAGGYHVTIVGVGEETVLAEIASGVVVTMEKSAVIRAADDLVTPDNT